MAKGLPANGAERFALSSTRRAYDITFEATLANRRARRYSRPVMRIVIIGNFGLYRKATMASRALPIARELASAGHSLTIVMPDEPPPASLASTDDGVRQVSVGRRRVTPIIGYLLIGLRIVWTVRRLRPDVVYSFKPIGYAGLALFAFWALRQVGLSSAVLALDTDDWEGEGGWADRDHHPWWERSLMIWQERWSLDHADLTTVASRELEKVASARGTRTVYAPNAASPASPGWVVGDGRAVRRTLELGDAPVILAYTRFVEFNPRRLVDLIAATRSRVSDARLVVVGKGLDDEDATLQRLIHKRGLEDVVHRVGWAENDQLPAYFAAADVAVYLLDDTLLNRTKCPMKLVDLLLAGVPVVSDDVGQAREYIRDGENGLLVPAGDVDAMASQVARLLGDDQYRRQLGQAARQAMLTSWTWAERATGIIATLASAQRGNSRR